MENERKFYKVHVSYDTKEIFIQNTYKQVINFDNKFKLKSIETVNEIEIRNNFTNKNEAKHLMKVLNRQHFVFSNHYFYIEIEKIDKILNTEPTKFTVIKSLLNSKYFKNRLRSEKLKNL